MERTHRRLIAVVERQEVEEQAGRFQRLDVVLVGAVGNGGFGGVRARAPEFFGRDDLVGHGLHDIRPGDEHIGTVTHHEDEVGHGRRIDSTTGAGPHDHGNLRDDAGSLGVAAEDLGIAGE
ncbi:hypothetical protein D9M68_227170 [compost metagenome]